MLISHCLSAQNVSPHRLTNWSDAGVIGGIPSYDSIVLVTAFGAKGDSITNDSAAFAQAVAHFGGKRGTILVPAGRFRINGTLVLNDSILLRGEGADKTTLYFSLNNQANDCISIRRTGGSAWVRVDPSSTKGGKVIRFSSSLSLAKGDWIEFRNRGRGLAGLSGRPDTAFGMINRVDSVSGLYVWLRDELRFTPDLNLLPEVRRITTIRAAGIECLTIQRLTHSNSAAGKNVLFEGAVNCWMRGVHSKLSLGAHVLASYSAHLTISGCYFDSARYYDGGGTRGYGVLLFRRTTLCLVENNIFRKLRHSMQLQEGSNANVFGYNYSRETYKVDFGIPFTITSDLNFHGFYPYFNLFEGNIGHYLHFDNANGPNGPWNLVHRNQVTVNGINFSSATFMSDSQTLTGNDASSQTLNGSGHYRHGNRIAGSTSPNGTDSLWVNSYYLTSKPWFWRVPVTWPGIGRPNSYNTGFNPAKKRWDDAEELTQCEYVAEWQGYDKSMDNPDNYGNIVAPRKHWFLTIGPVPPGGNMPELFSDAEFYRITLKSGASIKTHQYTLTIRENMYTWGTVEVGAGGTLQIGR